MCFVCFSCVLLFVTAWTVAHQAPLSMGFSRPEYWSGLPFPPLGVSPSFSWCCRGKPAHAPGRVPRVAPPTKDVPCPPNGRDQQTPFRVVGSHKQFICMCMLCVSNIYRIHFIYWLYSINGICCHLNTVLHTLSMWICVSPFHSLLCWMWVHCVEISQSTTHSPDQDSLWTNILNVILLKSCVFKPSFVFLFLRGTFSSNSALNILSELKKKTKNLFFPDYKMNSCPF